MLNFDRFTVKHSTQNIFKMIFTSGFLTASEYTEFVFAPYPTWGAYSAPPDPLAGLRGPASKWRERGNRGKGEKKGRGWERKGPPPLSQIPGSTTGLW